MFISNTASIQLAPNLVVSKSKLFLGEACAGESLEKNFSILNDGDSSVHFAFIPEPLKEEYFEKPHQFVISPSSCILEPKTRRIFTCSFISPVNSLPSEYTQSFLINCFNSLSPCNVCKLQHLWSNVSRTLKFFFKLNFKKRLTFLLRSL